MRLRFVLLFLCLTWLPAAAGALDEPSFSAAPEEMYQQGRSVEEIATHIGLSKRRIWQILKGWPRE